jgi:uncharacterized protein (TIGR02118 family)
MKMVALFRRRSGLTPAEFREHYEKQHVPLALRLFPSTFADYRRNYIRHDLRHQRGEGESPLPWLDFDVITEITFASRDDYERMVRAMSDPAIREQVVADETRFMDRSATVAYLVDEERTALPTEARTP